jgi:uncharacterized protein with HEPN domain
MRDRAKLEQILQLGDLIALQLVGYDEARFVADRDAVDSTAFRILSIGEATLRLSDELKGRHPGIDWRAIGAMRNVMAHNYEGIVPVFLWRVTTDHLPELLSIARAELAGFTAD